MTKLLQSRWTLPCALVAALAVWIGDLRSPQGSTVPQRPRKIVEPSAAAVTSVPTVRELSIDAALREWLVQQSNAVENVLREDPFLEWSDPRLVQPGSTGAVTALPVLRGISLGAGRPLAILDRTVVGEGETLGSWRIDRIERDTVWVDGPVGRVGLSLSRVPVPPTAAKASVPVATQPKSGHTPSTRPNPAPRK